MRDGEGSSTPEGGPLLHLSHVQLKQLTRAFQDWYDSAPTPFARKVRGRYWIAFLCLRYTGARIGEVLSLNDLTDLNFEQGEISIRVERRLPRTIPVPPRILSFVTEYLNDFPVMRGKIFTLDQGNFRREFYRRAEEAAIPKKLSHPHVLRHTRAMEMVLAGVPLGMVQTILGHRISTTVLLYLGQSAADPKAVLEDMGLL